MYSDPYANSPNVGAALPRLRGLKVPYTLNYTTWAAFVGAALPRLRGLKVHTLRILAKTARCWSGLAPLEGTES